jgi:hypothetical protein
LGQKVAYTFEGSFSLIGGNSYANHAIGVAGNRLKKTNSK